MTISCDQGIISFDVTIKKTGSSWDAKSMLPGFSTWLFLNFLLRNILYIIVLQFTGAVDTSTVESDSLWHTSLIQILRVVSMEGGSDNYCMYWQMLVLQKISILFIISSMLVDAELFLNCGALLFLKFLLETSACSPLYCVFQ